MKFISSIICVFFITGLSQAKTEEKKCSKQDSIDAEDIASYWTIKDWQILYMVFKEFKHCDDGSIAEGFDDAVTGIFLNKPGADIRKLYRFTEKDKAFEEFLLRHIDEVSGISELRKIKKTVEENCTKEAKNLCKKIVETIEPYIKNGRSNTK